MSEDANPYSSVQLVPFTRQTPVIIAFRLKGEEFLASAKSFVIDSAEKKVEAVAILGRMAALKTEAERARVAEVKPHNDWVLGVNSAFKSVLDPVLQADVLLRSGVLAYERQERDRAAAAANVARLAQEAADQAEAAMVRALEASEHAEVAEALDRAAEAERRAHQEAAVVALIGQVVPPPRTTVAVTGASSTTKRVWKYRITKWADIPRRYLLLDDSGINSAVRALTGLVDKDDEADVNSVRAAIPGLAIFLDDTLSVRS
jgi:hypothetical protein